MSDKPSFLRVSLSFSEEDLVAAGFSLDASTVSITLECVSGILMGIAGNLQELADTEPNGVVANRYRREAKLMKAAKREYELVQDWTYRPPQQNQAAKPSPTQPDPDWSHAT